MSLHRHTTNCERRTSAPMLRSAAAMLAAALTTAATTAIIGSQAAPRVASPRLDSLVVAEIPPAPADSLLSTAVAQRAVLDQGEHFPLSKRFPGSVVWRIETPSGGIGALPVIYACITIPKAGMNLVWSLRQVRGRLLMDESGPKAASHMMITTLSLPQDFAHRGVFTIPGLLAKENKDERPLPPLSGFWMPVAAKVFFGALIDTGVRGRNVQLLKSASWLAVPMVYEDHWAGSLSFEKGAPGERIFALAFAAWGDGPGQGPDTLIKRTEIGPEACPAAGPIASR